MAELKITVGEIKTESVLHNGGDYQHSIDGFGDIERGVRGEIRSFLTAKVEPVVYGPIEPCAIFTVRHGDEPGGDKPIAWSGRLPDEECSLALKGSGETDSFRVEVGLNDIAERTLKENVRERHHIKNYAAAKAKGEARRWVYPDNWRVWPQSIEIDGKGEGMKTLRGTYMRAGCQQTVNQSALWIRRGTIENPALYLIIKPEISRIGSDRAVISSSISHEDVSSILAIFPQKWQPCDSLDEDLHEVKGIQLTRWIPLLSMRCLVPLSNISVSSGKGYLAMISGLRDIDLAILCDDEEGGSKVEDIIRLNMTRGQKAQKTVRAFNSICTASILRHAASIEFPYDLTPNAAWIDLSPEDTEKGPSLFGCCDLTIPPRPEEQWMFNSERREWERYSEPGASRAYYLALRSAPQTFDVLLNRLKRTLLVRFHPEVAAHHAAAQLIEGRGENIRNKIKVQYRLSSFQEDPVVDRFMVHNCDVEEPTDVTLAHGHILYERQMKVRFALDGGSDYFMAF